MTLLIQFIDIAIVGHMVAQEQGTLVHVTRFYFKSKILF